MTFTPIFIPMHSGGGGGGGPIWPVIVVYAIAIGGIVKLYDYSFSPQFHLELNPHRNGADLVLNKHNYPHIQRVTHVNIECLEKKGYRIYSSLYSNNLNISKSDFNVKQLIADCKECNTYVEVDYEYDTLFSGKTKDTTKRLNWSSCNIRRELQ